METKARRSSRASGSPASPSELPKPIEIPAEAEVASSTHAAEPAESLPVSSEPSVTAPDPEPTASLPNVDTPPKEAKGGSSDQFSDFSRGAFAALTQSQAALARGLEAFSAEMAGLALSGLETATRAATKMLGIKTLSDAIDVNTGFACSSLDVWVGGSAKISELGVKLAAETSRPFLAQFGKGWGTASRRALSAPGPAIRPSPEKLGFGDR
jgi:hypothetical protein